MSSKTSARRGPNSPIAIPAALHIPVSVLAQMPEKLRVLGQRIKATSKVINCPYKEFSEEHRKARNAFDDANGKANCIVNAIAQLADLDTDEMTSVVEAARSAQNLTSAIYKACGNIHNDDCFKTTFGDAGTVEATIAALAECGDMIRATVHPFGY